MLQITMDVDKKTNPKTVAAALRALADQFSGKGAKVDTAAEDADDNFGDAEEGDDTEADDTEAGEDSDDLGLDDDGDDADAAPTKKDVAKAVKAYAERKGKPGKPNSGAALAMLKKFKASNIHNLKEAHYAKFIAALK